ncbi:hypothetical protein [Marivivens aquimaris]|uniref:hypothetical protein n=1 Tax=Marivivens aquimaris TaxID=2774876 RepID=UPI00187E799F|nr:hypothetical protein [Marivivens aquimaris]
MKRIATASLFALSLMSAPAFAGGIVMNFPTVTWPTTDPVISTDVCVVNGANATTQCVAQ